ncbi:MAG TPA: DUF5074 domain-containing protein [Flavobacteriales bacterium]|nr:DUF5074 domain-containing protein [Flavobacteriales bacterium]
MKLYKYILLFILASGTIFSCKKDIPPERPQEDVTLGASGGVFIVNEGNYLFGNAKLGYYNKAENSTVIDLYEETNGTGAGDVLQSMYVFNSRAFLVVNNSGYIKVCDPVTLANTATIAGFTSPRYFLPVSNNKAYVTDLYANKIWIVNLASNSISGSVPLNGWCEEMAEIFGMVYIANYTRGKVYVLDASTDVLVDSISLTKGCGSIRQDANGKLWALCSGETATSTPAALYRIDPITNNVEFTLPLPNSPARLCTNGTADTLYFLNSGVYQFPIASTSMSASPLIPTGTSNFYGLGIDPHTSLIYVSDAKDYIQYGRVLIHKPNGTFVKEFDTGIIPGDFWFQ